MTQRHGSAIPECGAALVAGELAQAGVRTLFGVMGDGNVDLIAACVELHGITYLSARHEQGAVSMAEGFAHASGEYGVATVTYGPGATNALTAVTTAARHRARVLLIGGHRTGMQGPPQYHDPEALFAPSGARVLRIDHDGDLAGAVQRAFDMLSDGSGPVVLSLADRLLEGPAPLCRAPSLAVGPRHPPEATPDPAILDDIAAELVRAERPLILAGRGARANGAVIVALAERCGAAMMTSLMGHGLFGDHPQALGISGGLARPQGQAAMRAADAVLVLGAGLNGWTVAAGDAFADARVMQVDSDALAFERSFVLPHTALTAQVGATCRALLARLPSRPEDRPYSRFWWHDMSPPSVAVPLMSNGRLDPDALAQELDSALPRDRALALDGGHFFESLCREIQINDPRAFFWTLGFGAVGLGLATGLGAAIARPDRLTVIGIGDGGLIMSLPELETLARLKLPVLLLVMNDASYGAEEKLLAAKGWRPDLARFPRTDFAALARSLGIDGATLTTESDLRAILPRLGNLRTPLLLDAHIDQSRDAGFVSLLHRLKAMTG
jgi:acetolactate synthase I/II/III large subunit